jgi:hypothetical protein
MCIWLFKEDTGIRWFHHVNQGKHKHSGSSDVGIKIENIIKLEKISEDEFDAEFSLVWG